MDKIARIKDLVSQLNQYRNSYYNENNSLVSDAEYDKLFDELQQLERESGFILSNSPTKSVGYEVKSKLEKVQHSIPLLSLDKTKLIDDIIKFRNNKELVEMLKLDGLTVELIYDDGKLVSASTRGDGVEGECITHNARTFKNLPLTISFNGHIKLSGEALIHINHFDKINENLTEDEKKKLEKGRYSTPRNLVSGTVRQLNSKICAERNVYFYAYNILKYDDEQILTKQEELILLETLGFGTVNRLYIQPNETYGNIESKINRLKVKAEERFIPIDGIVFTHNDKAYGESLGSTSHHPLHSIAFKFEDETATTTFRGIEVSMGRTGQLTPVALFDTVELDGTEVSRASLHNISIMENLQLGVGDEIVVYKANMIIPQILRNNTQSNTLKIPTKCPFCSEATKVVQENESKILMCTNENCSGKLLSKFTHFVSKSAMNIDGLSEATLEKFINRGWLKTFADIYRLNEHRDSIVKMDGFGKRSYEKLWSAIEQSKNVSLSNFIVALGLDNIGRTASKVISKRFSGDWFEFEKAVNDGFDFAKLSDFGEVMNSSIHDYFNNASNHVWYAPLTYVMNFEKLQESKNSTDSKIKDLTFVITGSVSHYKNRDELKEEIERLGGKVGGSVSVKTNYLINNDLTSTSGKNKKAIELSVKIISEDDFISMI